MIDPKNTREIAKTNPDVDVGALDELHRLNELVGWRDEGFRLTRAFDEAPALHCYLDGRKAK